MFANDMHKKEMQLLDDEEWLEELMDTFGDRLTNLSYTYLKDWGRAQEVVQDVFLTCFKKRVQMNGLASVEAWMYRITVNRCKDVLRTSWIKRIIVTDTLFQFRASKERSPEEISLTKSEREQLAQLIIKLPVKYKEVILLFYYEDLSIEEMSYVLHTNQNTIKTRLKRGRELLRKNMEGSDPFEG